MMVVPTMISPVLLRYAAHIVCKQLHTSFHLPGTCPCRPARRRVSELVESLYVTLDCHAKYQPQSKCLQFCESDSDYD